MSAPNIAGSARFVPPSIDYAKRAARHLQRLLQDQTGTPYKLHDAQALVARAYQFADWFALTQWLKREGARPSPLDADCTALELEQRRNWAQTAIAQIKGISPEAVSTLVDKAVLTGAPQARKPYFDKSPTAEAVDPPSDDGFLAWFRPFRPALVETMMRLSLASEAKESDLTTLRDHLDQSTGARWLSHYLAEHQREQGRWYIDACIKDYCLGQDHDAPDNEAGAFPLNDRARFAKLILRDLMKPNQAQALEELLRWNIFRSSRHWRYFKDAAPNSTDRAIYAELERILNRVISGTEQEAQALLSAAARRQLPESHNRLIGHDEPDAEPTTFFARLLSTISLDMVVTLAEFPYHRALQAVEGSREWITQAQLAATSSSKGRKERKPPSSPPTEPASVKQRIDDLHEQLSWWTAIEAFIQREYGDGAMQDAWAEFTAGKANAPQLVDLEHTTFFIAWMAYFWKPASGPHAGVEPTRAWLSSDGKDCDPLWNSYCEAAMQSPYSIFQVVSTKPATSFEVRDLFLGTVIEVLDSKASIHLEQGSVLYAHLVTVSGFVLLMGVDSQPLPAAAFGKVLVIRDQLGVAGKTAGRLRKMDSVVRRWWWKVRQDALTFKLPKLQNTDGHDLKLQELTFTVGDTDATYNALSDLDDRPTLTRDKGGKLTKAELAWTVASARSPGYSNTLIATFTIEQDRLVVSVNSDERAETVKQLIKDRIGKKARLIDTQVTTAEELESQMRHDGPEVQEALAKQSQLLAIPGVQAFIQRDLTDYYRKWIDSSIPYLKGQTPRAAARSREGRHLLESLLTSMSNAPGMKDGIADMLRRELKLSGPDPHDPKQSTPQRTNGPYLRVYPEGLIEGSPIHRAVVRFAHPFPPNAAMALWMDEFSTAILGQMLLVDADNRDDVDPDLLRYSVTSGLPAEEAVNAWIKQNLIDDPVKFEHAIPLDAFPKASLFQDVFAKLKEYGSS